ncbi:MAG: hypothetical protein FIB02_05775 [Desulfuromonas sp.]|nr:hypothetical protein [Desulfuromonas sp.]
MITVPAGLTVGSYTVTVYAVGHSGSSRANISKSITVNITAGSDSTAPVVGTVTPANTATATYVDGTFDLSAAITEANTLASCQYTTDGSTWLAGTVGGAAPNWTCTKTGITAADGTALTLNIRGTDGSSNTGTGTAVARTVDAVAPTTTDNVPVGWQTANVTVTLTPADARSGVASTVYCVDTANSCVPGTAYAAPFIVSTEGTNYVRYRSTDNVGNVQTVVSKTLQLDKTAPVNGTLSGTPGSTQIALSWSGFSDTASGLNATDAYKLVYNVGATIPSSGCIDGTEIAAVTTGTSYPHTGLTNGQQYSYRLCAIDAAGLTSTGATYQGTPTATTPPNTTITAPTASAVLTTTPYSISGTATAGTNPLGSVLVSTNNGSTWNTATGTVSWSYSWTLPSEDYIAHTILAKARDNQGTPLEDPTPASVGIWVDNVAPTGLANSAPANSATGIATNTALTANTAAVADGNPGAKQYYFQIATDAGFTASLQQSAWQAASSWTPGTALANNTTYYWHVKVRDAANNESAYTTTWSFTTVAAGNSAPATPTALAQYQSDGVTTIASGGAATTNSVILKGTLSDPDSNKVIIEVDINTDGTADCVSGLVASGSTATATCTALADGSYNWQARSRDSAGATSAWTAFTGGPPDFTVSTGLDIGIDTTAPTESGLALAPGDTVIGLSWNPASDGTGSGLDPANTYKVVRSTVATPADCSAAGIYTGNLNAYNDSGLTNGTTYYYRVCAYDRVGNVSAGQTASAAPGSACTYAAPTVSILTGSKSIGNDGGFAEYTVSVTNNDVGACAATAFDLTVSDSNATAFYPTAITVDPLTVGAGATVQTSIRVAARPNQSNGTTNTSYFYTAADGNHVQSANSNSVVTTISVSGGGCVAGGSYLSANGDQMITSR